MQSLNIDLNQVLLELETQENHFDIVDLYNDDLDLNNDLDVNDSQLYDLDLNKDVVGDNGFEQCNELETLTAMSINSLVAPTIGFWVLGERGRMFF